MPAQDWSIGLHPNTSTNSPYINLSITPLSDGTACSYSCACSGSYCCDGATEYTDGSGSGTCQNSVCAAATTTTTTAVSRPAGGGPAATTTTLVTTTTTIPLAPVEETSAIESIDAGETGTFEFIESDLAISEIEVTTTSAVSSPSVTATQSSSAPGTVAIVAPNTVYGYLTIVKENIEDEDVSEVKIKFKVTKAWISDNNIDEETIAMMRYSDGAWSELSTSKVSEDETYVYFEATSTALSVFAISAEQLPPTTTTAPTTTTVPTTTTTRPPFVMPTGTTLYAIIIIVILIAIIVLWKTGILHFD